MSKNTWILIAALAAAPMVTSGVAFAQDTAPSDAPACPHGGHGGHHGHRGGHGPRVEMLTAILGLDATQEASIRQIFEASRPRREQIMQLTDHAARHTAMEALHTETRAAMDAVLSVEQRATLDRMEAERRAHGPRGRGHGRRGTAPAAPAAPVGI